MKTSVFASMFFCACALSRAQSIPSPTPADPVSVSHYQLEMFTRAAKDGSAEAAREAANKREVEAARAEFYGKANEFVALWTSFAAEMNGQQTFNAKLAKRLSKAFHDLEKSEGWPVATK